MTLAYLDPTSGSLIISAVVGGAAAAGVAAKQARAKLTGAFGRKRKQEFSPAEPSTPQVPAEPVAAVEAEPASREPT